MMLHSHTPVHPLIHHGTQQRERLLQQLMPTYLKLDDRSIADLIAFSGQLATEIQFWDQENKTSGNWVPFWESDLTTLLALIAATDLDSIRTQYRTAELNLLRLEKRKERGLPVDQQEADSLIRSLVTSEAFGIFGIAKRIANICRKAPANHAIKSEIIGLIKTDLQLPFVHLIQYHKGSVNHALTAQYAPFIGSTDCALPWGIPDENAFHRIDYIEPFEFRVELWKLFLKFYKALRFIVQRADRAFRTAIRSRKDHHPHITLFLTFLHLFRYLQTDLNSLTEKHLLFYYQDILRLQGRRIIPDQVHVVFEIALNLDRYRIEKGTLLLGGADVKGRDRLYSLQEGIVASHVRLVEKKNYYFSEQVDAEGNPQFLTLVMQAADKKDGVKEDFAAGLKIWSGLSGKWLYDDLMYKISRIEYIEEVAKVREVELPTLIRQQKESYTLQLEALKPATGFIITSAEFLLRKNLHRGIYLEFGGGKSELPISEFKVEISTAEGPRFLNEGSVQELSLPDVKPQDQKTRFNFFWKNIGEKDPSGKIYKIKGYNSFFINLKESFPDINLSPEGKMPYIKFTARKLVQPLSTPIFNSLYASSGSQSEGPISSSSPPVAVNAPPVFGLSGLVASSQINIPHPDEIIGQSTFFQGTHKAYVKINELFLKNVADSISLGHKDSPTGVTVTMINQGEKVTTVPRRYGGEQGWAVLDIAVNTDTPLNIRETDVSIKQYFSRLRLIPFNRNLDVNHRIEQYNVLGRWAPSFGTAPFSASPRLRQPMLDPILSIDLLHEWDANEGIIVKDTKTAEANGNLFLGFENITPGQTLSVLFKTADGTGNPDHFAPDITWSYLSDNQWKAMPGQYIISDSTLGMKQTGIILFQLPNDIDNGNTEIVGEGGREDLYWLRASATEYPADLILVDALPMLVDIYVNAATAVFKDAQNSHEHLEPGLAPKTISALRFRDVNVKVVEQPFASFDGRNSENGDAPAYYRRIHERLRHRQRAVTIWDYERILLEQFPKVSIAKCLSHTRRFAARMPGYVTMAVVPYPYKMVGFRKYYPTLEAGDLAQMHDFLSQRNSYFVSGFGGPGFCCCQENTDSNTSHPDCCCNGVPNKLSVINARFEPIRLRVCVRFRESLDPVLHKKRLNEALKNFLAPWALDEQHPLLFGSPIHTTQLLGFLENIPYVDIIADLKYKHFPTKASADHEELALDWSVVEEIQPFTAASVLTTYLDRLNADNPNVIDHDIQVLKDHDKCTCADCIEKAQEDDSKDDDPKGKNSTEEQSGTTSEFTLELEKKFLRDLWLLDGNTNKVLKEYQRRLNALIMEEKLFGVTITQAEQGEEGRHAYKFEKIKTGNRITSVKIHLATKEGTFETFELENPNL